MESKVERSTGGGVGGANSLIALFEMSMCGTCGMSLHEVKFREDGRLFILPRTVPGIVQLGRCLYCRPIPRPASHPDSVVSVSSSQVTMPFAPHSEDGGISKEKVFFRDENHAVSGEIDKDLSESENEGAANVVDCNASTKEQDDAPLSLSVRNANGFVYEGTIEEGTKQQGLGTFKHVHSEPHLRGSISTYKGTYKDGLIHGMGTLQLAEGTTYVGEFVNGYAHGHGRRTWDEGWEYDGEWAYGKRHGNGTCRQKVNGGQQYSGTWKNDKWHGEGTLKFPGGGQYAGSFHKGRLQGQGRYEFTDGSVYDGYFHDDLRNGVGKMTYCSRETYVGEWSNDLRHGQGTFFGIDGTIFKGKWHDDEKHGIGYLHMPDGFLQRQNWFHGVLQSDP